MSRDIPTDIPIAICFQTAMGMLQAIINQVVSACYKQKKAMQAHRLFNDLYDQKLTNSPLGIHHHKNNQRDKEYRS